MAPRQVSSFDQLDALLAEGKITEEEYHDLWNALKGKGAGGAGQEGAVPGEAARKTALSGREKAVILVCAFLQMVVLLGCLLGNPILPAVGGFASIVAYIVTPREWRFVKRITLITAIMGAVEIVMSILFAS